MYREIDSSFSFKDKIITFKMEGKLFEEGFDLYSTIESLNSFQNILDKSYLALVDRERMSKHDRELFKIKATDIRKGSFISDLLMYVGATMQIAYPLINAYHPSLVIDIVKEGFTYLKTILEAEKEGKEIKVENSGKGGNVTLIIEGNNTAPINIGSKSVVFANKAYDDFRSLTSNIDGEDIREINIIDREITSNSIKLSPKEKDIFNIESKLDEIPIEFTGKIYRLDSKLKNGKLIICECDECKLKNKEINFELMDGRDIDKFCEVFNKEAKFMALKKTQYNPTTLIYEIKTLKIFKIQYDLKS